MSTITLKGIPEYLHKQLKKEAQLNHRSLNQEILSKLEITIAQRPINIHPTLKRARQLRKYVSGYLTGEKLEKMINQDRP